MKLFMIILSAYIVSTTFTRAALNESQCADLIVVEIQSLNPGVLQPRLKPFWEAICRGLITHIKAQMEINLQIGDVKTPGANGLISTNPGSPVGGVGLSAPGLIPSGRIQ